MSGFVLGTFFVRLTDAPIVSRFVQGTLLCASHTAWLSQAIPSLMDGACVVVGEGFLFRWPTQTLIPTACVVVGEGFLLGGPPRL